MTYENAATWQAVSSKAQDRADKKSLDNQDAATAEYCEGHGLKVIEKLVSRQSRSSSSANPLFESDNPAYIRLIELCESKAIQHVVFDRDDRIARDYLLAEQVYRLCLNNGVVVHSVANGTVTRSMDEDPLARLITAYSSNRAVAATVRAVKRGLADRNSRGFLPNDRAFGYRSIYDSERNWLRYEVVEDERDIVMQILDMYESNMGIEPIAVEVDMTPGRVRRVVGNVWMYAGYAVLYVDRAREEKRHYLVPIDKNPLARKTKGQHYDLAFISEERARRIEAAQIERGTNKVTAKHKHLFSGMVICAKCGKGMNGGNYTTTTGHGTRYRCNQFDCEDYRGGVNEKAILAAVVDAMERHREALGSVNISQYQEAITPTADDRREAIRRQMDQQDRRLLNLTRMIADTGDETMLQVRSEIIAKKDALQTELDSIEDDREPPSTDEQIDTINGVMLLLGSADKKSVNALIRDMFHITHNSKTKVTVAEYLP